VNPLAVSLNRLQLKNPVLVASGTFGYAREMAPYLDLSALGGIIPKTVTQQPRIGNAPQRTVETSSGMLNSIGLDNDGLETFIEKHLPYLTSLGTAVIVNIAGKTIEEFVQMTERLAPLSGIAALELNISCPNVTGGVDYGTNPEMAFELTQKVMAVSPHPIIIKLTPNVTDVTAIAKAVADGGADAVSLINTVQGMAIDWKRRKPILGNVIGGLSGPAIKPVALRCVHQVAQKVNIPIIGIGGITTFDDMMEFFVAGASAIQVGTTNFFKPGQSQNLLQELKAYVEHTNLPSITSLIKTLELPTVKKC
jgi:dihydroorotate dehydrogenase (NAD+) catalytic subunit